MRVWDSWIRLCEFEYEIAWVWKNLSVRFCEFGIIRVKWDKAQDTFAKLIKPGAPKPFVERATYHMQERATSNVYRRSFRWRPKKLSSPEIDIIFTEKLAQNPPQKKKKIEN